MPFRVPSTTEGLLALHICLFPFLGFFLLTLGRCSGCSVQFSHSVMSNSAGGLDFEIPSLSAQFSCSVVSNSLWPHRLQYARLAVHHQFILCHPLLLPPSIFPSIRGFSNESALSIRWLKYWSFSFSISPSNEYSGLISFRMDWLGLLLSKGNLGCYLLEISAQSHIILT